MRRTQLSFVVAVMICSPGCLSFSGDRLEEIDPPQARRAVSIESGFRDFLFQVDGGAISTSASIADKLNRDVLRRWQRRGYVSRFNQRGRKEFTDRPDFTLALSGSLDGRSNVFLQILSGLTLLVIPHYINAEAYFSYELTNTKTGQVYKADVEEDVLRVFWLPFIVGLQFMKVGESHAIDKVALHLYKQFAEQGAFD